MFLHHRWGDWSQTRYLFNLTLAIINDQDNQHIKEKNIHIFKPLEMLLNLPFHLPSKFVLVLGMTLDV
jgi:hypothetical protein